MKGRGAPLERTIQSNILKYLRTQPGVYAWKMQAGMYAAAGLPDIMAVRAGHLYALEVKRPGGKPTDLQRATLDRLAKCGATAAVVTSVEDVKEVMAR